MLTWPTADQLPANFEALGMASCEHLLQFVDPSTVFAISHLALACGYEDDSEGCNIDLPLDSTPAAVIHTTDQKPHANARRLRKTQPRPLNTIEEALFALLHKKTWMAYSQPTQLHLRGAEQINYLSRNVPPFELEDEYIEEFS